ncbi:MAG: addiction module toxin, HicA family [Acidobacteria bacterium]|nr:MAG: addiction module toxin, HicA family [Acidobacteriota bacterium]
MKRTDLIRHLTAHGCQLLREGGRHSIFWNPTNHKTSAVPRHAEVVDPVANRIKIWVFPAPANRRTPS